MALDEPRDSDEVFKEQGFTFCMDKDLYQKTQGVMIDAGYMGFIVQSSVPLNSGASSNCGGCSGGCN